MRSPGGSWGPCEALLGRFGGHLGGLLGRLGASESGKGAKANNIDKTNENKRFVPFAKEGPKTAPRRPKKAPRRPKSRPRRPKMPPRRLKTPPIRPKTLPRRPKTPQDAPKMPPRRPKMPPRCSQDAPRCLQDAPRCFKKLCIQMGSKLVHLSPNPFSQAMLPKPTLLTCRDN